MPWTARRDPFIFWGAELLYTFIDITGALDLKLQAVQAHRS
jgi:hypothetical protein